MIRLKTLLEQITPEERAAQMAKEDYDPYQYVREIAAAFGETYNGEDLGGGANGRAFGLASGKVLKITQDRDEIVSAAHFRTRSKARHIISYYDARRVIPRANNAMYWAIILDRVRTLEKWEAYIWNAIQQRFFDTAYTNVELHQYVMTYTAQEMQRIPNYKNTNVDDIEAWIESMIRQRAEILRDVKSYGIRTYEAHQGNVGFDAHGQFVIFDLWSSRSSRNTSVIASLRKLNKPVDLRPLLQRGKPDASGIDTPNNPDM
jgi:hypothetical protein